MPRAAIHSICKNAAEFHCEESLSDCWVHRTIKRNNLYFLIVLFAVVGRRRINVINSRVWDMFRGRYCWLALFRDGIEIVANLYYLR